ncbi:unnamed protein product [Sympodiomycopsis kandeliae]
MSENDAITTVDADAEKKSSSTPSPPTGTAPRAPVAEIAQDVAQQQSSKSTFKAKFFGQTKAARAAAAAKALQDEKERQNNVDPTPFKFKPIVLADIVDPKSVEKVRDLGGINAIVAGLGTNAERGLDIPIAGNVNSSAAAAGDIESISAKDGSTTRAPNSPEPVIASPADRDRVYGRNVLPAKKAKSLWLLMWLALQDKILIILMIAAVISLALGFYADYGGGDHTVPCTSSPTGQCPKPKVDFVEGLAILIAVVVVVGVGSLNDYGKERQLQALNAQKDERNVRVIRQGKPGLMSVHDVTVGDVLQIEPGEVIPADGIFLRGHNVKCDESGATGESDLIKKATYDECLADFESGKHSKRDPFLISGARVQEGVGEYVVTAVGPISFNGKLMMSLNTEAEDTPLQSKLNNLAGIIAKLGSAAGLLLFIVLFIRFLADLRNFEGDANDKGQRFISVLVLAVTLVVVAIPEGLPLAVTLALAFATRRMAKQNLLVRLLGSCETMGAATVICTDKTGTLTQNQMNVVAGSAGVHCKFVRRLEEHSNRVQSDDKTTSGDWSIEQAELSQVIDGELRTLWNDSIAVNSTAFEESAEDAAAAADAGAAAKSGPLSKITSLFKKQTKSKDAAKGGFVGSKTETALLSLAKDLGWEDYRIRRKANEVVTSYPFSSDRKAMAVVVKKPSGDGYRLMVKGASEVITQLCSHTVEIPHGSDADKGIIAATPISEQDRTNIQQTIMFYANQTLRTLGLAYKDFEQWPPADATFVENDGETDTKEVDYKSLAKNMTLLSVVAIEDPLRDGVSKAVEDAHTAGLRVIMVTGDNSLTARSIAAQCGIWDESKQPVIMEGPVFRNLPDSQLRSVVPHLAVLARSSPQDKQRLVETLKSMDEIVAVTGDGTNDAAALKAANIGFSMGIAGTEIAKEASDIILLDDRFSSIVTALLWGRCVRDAVRKFLQFQLAVNVGAVIITFVTSVASSDESSALTAVQLLWLNLIMDTMAALALATDPASPALLRRKPERPNGPLISVDMWKMIVGQSLYQVAFVLTLNFAGHKILGFDTEGIDETVARKNDLIVKALTFNVFVWCQLFNQVNARRLDRKFNIFEGLFRNKWFLMILAIEIGAQVLIVFVGGAAFTVTRLEGKYWAISIIGGLVSWPLAVLIKLVPTAPIERVLIDYGLISDPNAAPYDAPAVDEANEKLKNQHWSEPKLGDLADELDWYYARQGGRRRGQRTSLLKNGWRYALETIWDRMLHRDHTHKNDVEDKPRPQQQQTQTSSKSTSHSLHPSRFGVLMPGLSIAGFAGAWRPTNPSEASLANPAAGEPSLASWQLVRRGTNLRDQDEEDQQNGDDGQGKKKSAVFKGLMGGA